MILRNFVPAASNQYCHCRVRTGREHMDRGCHLSLNPLANAPKLAILFPRGSPYLVSATRHLPMRRVNIPIWFKTLDSLY